MLSNGTHIVFWSCLALILYVYVGYPLLLLSGLLGRRRPVRRGPALPFLSVLIPVHNEEKAIAAKLDNVLSADYPPDCREILVGDDASTDRTESIVRSFARENLRLISGRSRQGKSAIQNELVAHAAGSVLVFTDADCFLPPEIGRAHV